MNYIELVFTLHNGEDYQKDLLINSLGERGFDTFEETESGFNAYVPESDFSKEDIDDILGSFQGVIDASFEVNKVPHKNWNEIWESNFQPLIIGDKCYVRATFHEPRPEFPYEIIIDPKMAFGTGHHQTTSLMMQFLLEEDVVNKSVLDMGCGTGILAILAEKLQANDLLAIDYDPVCYDSTLENCSLNHSSYIRALCGSKEVIPERKFDLILANINRNILLDQLPAYRAVSDSGTVLLMSGFYESPDLEIIKHAAEQIGYHFTSHKTFDNWTAARFICN
ncbi:50S ribosomal protein L11 methyltransferase [Pedobacter sp. HMF7647]|uniref:Ribosomal protein L11 methyltransferase n=1 Tax=Hufsiella arboris TaxID=2695275 RepID=A0A7K1Y6M7_9SPHI|nr:50S ribosomal protein L11 methyltransferase [Hufsiella arboris]MXV50223.1 50S ribosomal protein L11 methyltransferase [Hufsiella arboris]